MTETPLFQVDNASFAYNSTQAIHNITTRLFPGNFYGIVGPNGCGKTTFLDLLTGSKQPQEGRITFNGAALSSFSKRELAKELALVPQEYDTGFGYTVEEVVLMGRHPHIDRFASPASADWEAVDAAIDSIGITELRNRYTTTLSGGQKQRAVVARALAQNSPVLLFDEATSSLDIRFSLQIFNIAKQLVRQENRTVIAVIHDLNLAAAYCDELLFMKEGRVEVHDKTPKALTAKTVYEVFGVHCQIDKDHHNNSLRVSYALPNV